MAFKKGNVMEEKNICDKWWVEIEYRDPYNYKKVDSPIFDSFNLDGKKITSASCLQRPLSFMEQKDTVSSPKIDDFCCEELNSLVYNILQKNYFLYDYVPRSFTIFKLSDQAKILELDNNNEIEKHLNGNYDAILVKNNQTLKCIGRCEGLYVFNLNMIEKMYLSNEISLWIKWYSEFGDNDLQLNKNGEFIDTNKIDQVMYSKILTANEASSVELTYVCNDVLNFLLQSGLDNEGRTLCLKN